MAESFGEQYDKQMVDKYMNPMGFLKENEFEKYDGVDKKGNLMEKTYMKEKEKTIQNNKQQEQQKKIQKEYGFKVKGLEPTRYGDWEIKGKCSDF